MEVANLNSQIVVILRQILRHPLCQGCYQHSSPLGDLSTNLPQEVIDLPFRRYDINVRIHQPRRPDDLFHNIMTCMFEFIGAGSGRHIDHLIETLFEFHKL